MDIRQVQCHTSCRIADVETLFDSINCTASFTHSDDVKHGDRRLCFCLFMQALFLSKWTQVCVMLMSAGLQPWEGNVRSRINPGLRWCRFSSSMICWFTLMQGPHLIPRTESFRCFSINSNLAQKTKAESIALRASTALSPPMSRWVPDTALAFCSLVKSVLFWDQDHFSLTGRCCSSLGEGPCTMSQAAIRVASLSEA